MTNVTITTRMKNAANELMEEFGALYERPVFLRAVNDLYAARGKSDYPSKLKKLYGLFDRLPVSYERGKEPAYYDALVASLQLPSYEELEDRMLYALYGRIGFFPSPADYMKRLVDTLSDPADGWENDTLRTRILKQFVKYGNSLADVGFGGRLTVRKYAESKRADKPRGKTPLTAAETADLLDDGVFAVLETAKAEQKKTDGTYGILNLADELAEGSFHGEGATRRRLYLFAIVYGMTCGEAAGAGHGGFADPRTDVGTNLFRDYYANNLLRFLTSSYLRNPSAYEPDPDGRGINYKNFAEMVWLYYIASDLPREEKLRRGAAMIDGLVTEFLGKGSSAPALTPSRETVFYRDLILNGEVGNEYYLGDVLSLPENDFRRFLAGFYDCDTQITYVKNGRTVVSRRSEMTLKSEQNTARRLLDRILDDLAAHYGEEDRQGYGLWTTEVTGPCEGLKRFLRLHPDCDREKYDAFVRMLENTDRILRRTPAELRAAPVTRTGLLTAFYYHYNAKNENTSCPDLGELFSDFAKEADPLLRAAGYQEISAKNLFDVMLVFSVYAYSNL